MGKLVYILAGWCLVLTVYCVGVTVYLLSNGPRDVTELTTRVAELQTKQAVDAARSELQTLVDESFKRLQLEGGKQVSEISDMGKSRAKALSDLMRGYMEEVNAHKQALDWAIRIAKSNGIN